MPRFALQCRTDYVEGKTKFSKKQLQKMLPDYEIELIKDPNYDYTATKDFENIEKAFEAGNKIKSNLYFKILKFAICVM